MNFLDTFLEWVGPSECPQIFLEWSARSLIAACMGNRTYVHMRIGAKDVQVLPNLYIILIGTSANFKSFAIDCAIADLLGTPDEPLFEWRDKMNLYTGRLTAQGMYDSMKTRSHKSNVDGTRTTIDIPHRGQLYLVTDELAADIGLGERATNLIMSLTKMYLSPSFNDRTRINGLVHLENYTINWLAGTTAEWMQLAMNKDTVLGGFFGRIITVTAPPSNKRIFSSERPHNWNNLRAQLINRLEEVFAMKGPFTKTPEAAAIEKAWYMDRETPREDDHTISNWRRQQGLSLKLALIESVIRGNEPYITGDHMEAGQLLAEQASKMLHTVMPSITTTNKDADALLRWVEKKGSCTRTELSRKALNAYGWRADELDRWVTTWIRAAVVVADEQARREGGTTYTYKGKRSR